MIGVIGAVIHFHSLEQFFSLNNIECTQVKQSEATHFNYAHLFRWNN